MPGTITTSWRRTQEAVRNASIIIAIGTFTHLTRGPSHGRFDTSATGLRGRRIELSLDPARTQAIHNRIGMLCPEVREHGFQRAVVTEIACAQEAAKADPQVPQPSFGRVSLADEAKSRQPPLWPFMEAWDSGATAGAPG